jgi:hypothetical protein
MRSFAGIFWKEKVTFFGVAELLGCKPGAASSYLCQYMEENCSIKKGNTEKQNQKTQTKKDS